MMIFRFGCEKGHEEDTVFEIMCKYALELSIGQENFISGAYTYKKKFPGAIFVEAKNLDTARIALRGIQQRTIRWWDVQEMKPDFIRRMFDPPCRENSHHIEVG